MPPVIGALAVPRGRGFFRACFDLEQCFVRAWCVLGPILFGAVLSAGLRVFSGHVFVWTFLLSAWVYLGRFCFFMFVWVRLLPHLGCCGSLLRGSHRSIFIWGFGELIDFRGRGPSPNRQWPVAAEYTLY